MNTTSLKGKIARLFALVTALLVLNGVLGVQNARACWDPTICGSNAQPISSTPSTTPSQPSPQPVAAPAAQAVITGSTYTVQPGDSLGNIANRANTTIAAIMAVNPQITNQNVISVGQLISLPSGTAVSAPSPTNANPVGTPTSPFHFQKNGVNITITPAAGLVIPAAGLAVAYVAAPSYGGGAIYGTVTASAASTAGLTTLGYVVAPAAGGVAFIIWALSGAQDIIWVPEGWTDNAPPVYPAQAGTPNAAQSTQTDTGNPPPPPQLPEACATAIILFETAAGGGQSIRLGQVTNIVANTTAQYNGMGIEMLANWVASNCGIHITKSIQHGKFVFRVDAAGW